MNLKIEIQKNIFLKTTITNHSRFKDPNIYFLPDFHLFFFFFFFPPDFQYTNGSCVVFLVHGTILQQSLARLFISGWHDCSTVAGMIIQQSLARLFNSGWHDCSTVTGTILQQWLARFFNSGWHDPSTVTGMIFSFLYAGRILQQWCSLLKNRTRYQEYDTWSIPIIIFFNVIINNVLGNLKDQMQLPIGVL